MSLFLFLLLVIVCTAVIVVLFLFKAIGFAYSYFFTGAVNVPSTEEKIKQMMSFVDFKPGIKAVDLGAGDGRLIIALAEKGIEAHGYEINPFLVSAANKKIKEAGLDHKAFMHSGNLWKVNLKDFDLVMLYGMSHMMAKLEEKFDRELKSGAIVISNHFILPTWKPSRVEDGIYLYIKN